MGKIKETVTKIKDVLDGPKITFELLIEIKDKNKVPEYFFEDALLAIKKIVKLLNKMARQDK